VVKWDKDRKEGSFSGIGKKLLLGLWRTGTIILPVCCGGEHAKNHVHPSNNTGHDKAGWKRLIHGEMQNKQQDR